MYLFLILIKLIHPGTTYAFTFMKSTSEVVK